MTIWSGLHHQPTVNIFFVLQQSLALYYIRLCCPKVIDQKPQQQAVARPRRSQMPLLPSTVTEAVTRPQMILDYPIALVARNAGNGSSHHPNNNNNNNNNNNLLCEIR